MPKLITQIWLGPPSYSSEFNSALVRVPKNRKQPTTGIM